MIGEENRPDLTTSEWDLAGDIANTAKKINSKKIVGTELPSTLANFQNDNTNGHQLSISKINFDKKDDKLALLQFIFQKPLQALDYNRKNQEVTFLQFISQKSLQALDHKSKDDQEKTYFAIPIFGEPGNEKGLTYIKKMYQDFLTLINLIKEMEEGDTEAEKKDPCTALVLAALKDAKAKLIFECSSDKMINKMINSFQKVVSNPCKFPVYSLKIKSKENLEEEICNSGSLENDNSPWDKLSKWALKYLFRDLNKTLQFLIYEIAKVHHEGLTISLDKECLLDLNRLTEENVSKLCNYLEKQDLSHKVVKNTIIFTGDITQKNIREKIKQKVESALSGYRRNFVTKNIAPILQEIFSVLGKDYDELLCCYLAKFYDKESDLEEILMTFTEHTAPENDLLNLEQLSSVHDLKEKVERINCKVQGWKKTVDDLNNNKKTWGEWKIKYDKGYYSNLTFSKVLDSKLLEFVATNNGLERNLVKNDQGNVIGMKFPMTESLDILNISNILINEYDKITQAQENIQTILSVICDNICIKSYSPLQLSTVSGEMANRMADFLNSKVQGNPAVANGKVVTVGSEITLEKLNEHLTPFYKRFSELQSQLDEEKQGLEKLSKSLEIQEQEISREIEKEEGEFEIKYIEPDKDVFISWKIGYENRTTWKHYKDVLGFFYDQDKNLVIYFLTDFSLDIVKKLVSLNRRIEQINEDIRSNMGLESTEFGFRAVEDQKVHFGFLMNNVVICKKKTPGNKTKDGFDENIKIDTSPGNKTKDGCDFIDLIIPLKTIEGHNFNLLDHVHIVKTADIEKVKEDIRDKLFSRGNYLVDINYKKQELCEIEITPSNKSIIKHKILSAVKLNDDISIVQNDRKILILLPVGKILDYAKKAECDYIKFFERDKNKEFAALIGVITFGIFAISTTIVLYSFIQKQNKFIIYETSVLLLEVLLAVCTSVCFYTYRDEKLTQIELSEINRGGEMR